jgi:hypothetical protein
MRRFGIVLMIGLVCVVVGISPPNVYLVLFGGILVGFSIGMNGVILYLQDSLYKLTSPMPIKCIRGVYGKDVVRLMSSNSVASHKAAILQLICSDWGASIVISDRAFAIEKFVTLSLSRMPRTCTCDDLFVINAEIDRIPQKPIFFSKPDKAVDHFLGIWAQWEVGEYFVELIARSFPGYTVETEKKLV